jgi:hypothetical protein
MLLSATFILGVTACKKNNICAGSACQVKSFTLFNAMHYENTPDLTSQSVHNFYLVYSSHLVSPDPNKHLNILPNLDNIEQVASDYLNQPTIPVSLDIESWSYASSQLDTTISRFLQVIDAFKTVNSSSPLGFYGVVPNDAYTWNNIQPTGGAKYIKWQNLNASLAPIANKVDIFFPSFYTFDDDSVSWRNLVTATLNEVRKYNRNIPVYAYLWPQYHDGTALQFQFVDTSVWKYELEALYLLTDGIVIWSSNKDQFGNIISWDATMPWWQTTQAFVMSHGIK